MRNPQHAISILLVCLYVTFTAANAQSIQWQNTIGGTAWDYLYSIEQTTDGGFIAGGHSRSNTSPDKNENCINNSHDYWVLKLDPLGNIQWQNTIGGGNADLLRVIHQTSDGGYILTGSSLSDSGFDKTKNSNGLCDFWIMKLDGYGNIQWQNTIGGSASDSAFTVEPTYDGGYIFGGISLSNISGDKAENCIGLWDYWIVKTDSIGNIEWQNTIGGTGNDYLSYVAQTPDGGYFVGGSSESNISGDKTENSKGPVSIWILKLDNIGNILWQKTIGGSALDYLFDVVQVFDGGYVIASSSTSPVSGDKTEWFYPNYDYWVFKIDSIGNILWQNTIGGNGVDQLTAICTTSDNGFLLGGVSTSDISFDKTESCRGIYDYWVVKITNIGDIQWQKTIGGDENDLLFNVSQNLDGSYILGGYSMSNMSGDKTENNVGLGWQADYWIVQIKTDYNLITGKVFADFNGNNLFDNNDVEIPNIAVVESNTGLLSFTDLSGHFYIAMPDTGLFSCSPAPINNYVISPLNHTAFFSGYAQIDSGNHFAFQPLSAFNDLGVALTSVTSFRTGFNAMYSINYFNTGTASLSPEIKLVLDNDVSYISSQVSPTYVSVDSIVWNLPTLMPLQSISFFVQVAVDLSAIPGTLIESIAQIKPVSGDIDSTNNVYNSQIVTTAAYDPNAILVDRITIPQDELIYSPYLDYIIHFQNVGNDTALNIRIENFISNHLDASSFDLIDFSHNLNLFFNNQSREVVFIFDNILLPDSNTNEPESQGFVRYRIRPIPTLLIGDSILNNAEIYFDFNPPVSTNSAITQIVNPTLLDEQQIDKKKSMIYPNPASGSFTIELNTSVILEIFSADGRLLYREEVDQGTHQKNITSLPAGIYIIRFIHTEGTVVQRLVVK